MSVQEVIENELKRVHEWNIGYAEICDETFLKYLTPLYNALHALSTSSVTYKDGEISVTKTNLGENLG